MKKIVSLFLIAFLLLLSFSLISCSNNDLGQEDGLENELENKNEISVIEGKNESSIIEAENAAVSLDEKGHYTSKEDVSFYIHLYDKLPDNFIKKKEASQLGWGTSQGNLRDVADKRSIGGDKFSNRESRLPIKKGRVYYECDINFAGGYRGPERLVYSNDGLIYYTGDHYNSFSLLYGEE